MGVSPPQVKGMSFWEFSAALAAWKKYRGIKGSNSGAASIERLRELGVE